MVGERHLSAEELADRWHVSTRTIYRLSKKRGGLKGVRIGARLRFSPGVVRAWEKKHQSNGGHGTNDDCVDIGK